MEVLDLTSDPSVDAAALRASIEKDPALTGKVLRVVNSSLFGLSQKVSDLNQALALLGTKPLKLLVLSFSLPTELSEGIESDVLARYWQRALTKAVACREISETVWHLPGDEAFIAGLLQDLGMLVLIQDLGEPYVRFLCRAAQEEGDLASLEMATLGFDHAILSARLLEHWGLPESLVQAVAMPHDVERLESLPEEQRPLPQTLHVADLVAELLTSQRTDVLPELLQIARRYHDLTRKQLRLLVCSLQEKVFQLANVFSLTLPEGTDFSDVLARAHVHMAELADEATCRLARCRDETDQLWEETRSLTEAVSELASAAPQSPAGHLAAKIQPDSDRTPGNGLGSAPAMPAPMTSAQDDDPDPALMGRLAAAVAASRQGRYDLTLMLVEVDNYENLILTRGPEGAALAVRTLGSAAGQLCDQQTACVQISDARFALILEDCDREQAVQTGRRFVDAVRHWSGKQTQGGVDGITVSVGIATVSVPPKNFPAQDLIEAADRCLNGTRSFGGSVVKSIAIY